MFVTVGGGNLLPLSVYSEYDAGEFYSYERPKQGNNNYLTVAEEGMRHETLQSGAFMPNPPHLPYGWNVMQGNFFY